MESKERLIYQIALTLVPGIGDVQGKKLVAYCGGAEAVFREKKKNLLKIPGVGRSLAGAIHTGEVLRKAEAEIAFIRQYKIDALFYLDAGYPDKLKHCEDGPMVLYYKGSVLTGRPRVLSIVGTRSPTDYGRSVCEQIVHGLAELGVVIVSGLAYGIDTLAHRAALAAGLPTIGVLAHGLDQVYPFANRHLAEKMVGCGGLATEFMSGTKLNRDYFPRRNRIIAGMADATLVIESAGKGGALITADIANSYSRDVFAVPGRVTDVKSVGCNRLISANKAALVTSSEDICQMMGWDQRPVNIQAQQKLFLELSGPEKEIFDLLGRTGTAGIDEIYLNSGMSASKVAAILLKLEFDGLVSSLPGKIYRLNR